MVEDLYAGVPAHLDHDVAVAQQQAEQRLVERELVEPLEPQLKSGAPDYARPPDDANRGEHQCSSSDSACSDRRATSPDSTSTPSNA